MTSVVSSSPRNNNADQQQGPTSSSLNSLGMEDVFEAFMRAAEGGNTLAANQNVSLSNAIDVWSAACQMAEEAMLKRQSLVLPGFASVGIAKEVEGMGGIWRDRLSFVPCLTLAPAFISQFCSDRLGYHVANPQKYGGAVPVLLNGAALGAYSNLPRHVAVNVLKDIIRAIGRLLLEGHPATGKKLPLKVEMGFATLEFTAPALHTRWTRRFLDDLAGTIQEANMNGTLGNTTGSTSPRRPHTAPHVPVSGASAVENKTGGGGGGGPAPPPSSTARNNNNTMVTSASNNNNNTKPRAGLSLQPTAFSARAIPAPPTAPSPAAASGGASRRHNGAAQQQQQQRPSSARAAAATPPLPPSPSNSGRTPSSPSPSRCSSRASSRAATPSNYLQQQREYERQQQQREGSKPNMTTSFTNSSPRNREQFLAQLEKIAAADANAFVKGKARKAVFRRMRGTAFEESWNAQIALQKGREAKEREEERRRVEYFRRSLAEQAAKEYNDKIGRRNEERQIHEINKALAIKRDEIALPKQVSEPGDIFDCREPPARRDGHEAQILLHQMAEKKAREAKEKAADRVYQQHVAKQDADWNASLRHQKLQKQIQQRELMAEYAKQLELKQQEEARYKATMPKSGCILYGEEESAEDEKKERHAVKMRTREYQMENKRFLEEKERNEKMLAVERNVLNKNNRKLQDQLARQRAEEEHSSLRSRQNALADVLMRQMEERKAAEAKEKHERDTWRDFNYLKNESSDDES